MKRKIVYGLLLAVLIVYTSLSTTVQAKKICLNKKNVTMTVGTKTTLKLKNTKKKVTWTSSKKKVATVSKKGVVKAKKKGTVKISAKVGKKKYTCKVTVKAKKTGTSTNANSSTSNSNSSNTTSKPTVTPTATPKPSSGVVSLPTADPAHRDDGWVPGWY